MIGPYVLINLCTLLLYSEPSSGAKVAHAASVAGELTCGSILTSPCQEMREEVTDRQNTTRWHCWTRTDFSIYSSFWILSLQEIIKKCRFFFTLYKGIQKCHRSASTQSLCSGYVTHNLLVPARTVVTHLVLKAACSERRTGMKHKKDCRLFPVQFNFLSIKPQILLPSGRVTTFF